MEKCQYVKSLYIEYLRNLCIVEQTHNVLFIVVSFSEDKRNTKKKRNDYGCYNHSHYVICNGHVYCRSMRERAISFEIIEATTRSTAFSFTLLLIEISSYSNKVQ